MGTLVDIKQIKGLTETLATGIIRDYANVTGTAAVTSSPRWSARYDVTDPEVTEYTDGMKVAIVVPVAGNGAYGTALQINSLGYKPIVYGTSNMVSTRYPVGGIIIARYNAQQSAQIYLGAGRQNETVTGCWQVMDYDSTDEMTQRYSTGSYVSKKAAYRYTLMTQNLAGELVPLHSTAQNASTYNASTATNKNMTQEPFSPFGIMALNHYPVRVAEGGTIPAFRLYNKYSQNPQYFLNCGNTLTNGPLYLVTEPQPDGQVKLTTEGNPWTQILPNSADGKIYIHLGHCESATSFELYPHHPAYWHNGDHICLLSGDENHAKDLAPVERGAAASQAYAAGELVMTGKGLAKTAEDIDEGETLDGKTAPTTIAEELKGYVRKKPKSAAKNGIVVLKRINPAKTREGQRYFFSSGQITMFLDQDTYEGVSGSGFGAALAQNFNIIGRSAKGVTLRGKYKGVARLIRIISDEEAKTYGNITDAGVGIANWLITVQSSLNGGGNLPPGVTNAGGLSTNDLASPYFVIRKGRVVCVKEVDITEGQPAGKDLGRRAFGKKTLLENPNPHVFDINLKNRKKAHYRRGNGYGVSHSVERSWNESGTHTIKCRKMSKPVYGNPRGRTQHVVGIARGKLSIRVTARFAKCSKKGEYYYR